MAMSSVIVSTNSLAWSLKGALTNKVRAWCRNGNRRSTAVSPVKSFRNILEPVAIRSLPCAERSAAHEDCITSLFRSVHRRRNLLTRLMPKMARNGARATIALDGNASFPIPARAQL